MQLTIEPGKGQQNPMTCVPSLVKQVAKRAQANRTASWLGLSLSILVSLASLAACRSVKAVDDVPTWPRPKRGAVASEHRLATEVGIQVLKQGGNAADAAVATALALAVVYPRAGNLGGGGFALWVPHQGPSAALDFRETAPRAARPERYLDGNGEVDPKRSQQGPLSVGVPGTPAGLIELHHRFGSGLFSFGDLCKPAMRLADRGFRVDQRMAEALQSKSVRERMQRSQAALDIFYPGGLPLTEGQRLVQKDLAVTLQALAFRGVAGFYAGQHGELLVEELRRQLTRSGETQNWITANDLTQYQPVWRTPLRGWFRGHEIITMPPPSSGGLIILQVLSVLDGLPLNAQRSEALDQWERNSKHARSNDTAASKIERGHGPSAGLDDRILHWWIEALRWSFATRAEYMGDPDFVNVPMRELLAPQWVAACRVGLGERANPEHQTSLPDVPPESPQTTHLSVLDRRGNAVSLTTTLNSSFGSGIVVEGAGYLLNNEMDDFALLDQVPNQFGLVGSQANLIEAKKRPLSSMTPTVVRDGGHAVTLILGSPGGPRIITSVLGVLLRTLAFGESLEVAVEAPRLHQQWRPAVTQFEPGWDQRLLETLANRRQHPLEQKHELKDRWASVQAIQLAIGGRPKAVSDSRRNGNAQVE